MFSGTVYIDFIFYILAANTSEDGDHYNQQTPRHVNSQSSNETELIGETMTDNRHLIGEAVMTDNRHLIRSELSDDNFEVDPDEGDVTDKYLTSHYRKDVRNIST